MEFVVQEAARKVIEQELQRAKQIRQKQVRDQFCNWTEERRRRFEEEKKRQRRELAKQATEQAEVEAHKRIQELLHRHDLAMMEVGAAHRKAKELRKEEEERERRNKEMEVERELRGMEARKKAEKEHKKKTQRKMEPLKRKEYVRKSEDLRARNIVEEKRALSRKPLVEVPVIVAVSREEKKKETPDSFKKAESVEKQIKQDLEERRRRQQELAKRARERGKMALRKAQLERKLAQLQSDLMGNQSIGTGKQTAMLGLEDSGSFNNNQQQKEGSSKLSGAFPSAIGSPPAPARTSPRARTGRETVRFTEPLETLGRGRVVLTEEDDYNFAKVLHGSFHDVDDVDVRTKTRPFELEAEAETGIDSIQRGRKTLSKPDKKKQQEVVDFSKSRKKGKDVPLVDESAFKKAEFDWMLIQLQQELFGKPSGSGVRTELDDLLETTNNNLDEFSEFSTDFDSSDFESRRDRQGKLSAARDKEKSKDRSKSKEYEASDVFSIADSSTTTTRSPNESDNLSPETAPNLKKDKKYPESPQSEPDGPYTSTPVGNLVLKKSSSRSIGVAVSKKDLMLHRVVTKFLGRRVESIDLLPVSSSSSSDLLLDSTVATRTPTTTEGEESSASSYSYNNEKTVTSTPSSTESSSSKTYRKVVRIRPLSAASFTETDETTTTTDSRSTSNTNSGSGTGSATTFKFIL